MELNKYSEYMSKGNSYISIKLDLNEPVEINDFAAMFAGVGAQFEDFLAKNHPELKGQAKMYVREVRKGSIVADMFANIPDLVGYMDSALIILGFGSLFSKRVRKLIKGQFIEDASKSDLRELGETIRAVSHDSGGEMTIESLSYENNAWTTKVELKMSASDSRKAVNTLEKQKLALDKKESADHKRKLMVFTRSDVFDAKLDKKSGEHVIINDISPNPRPLIYGSGIAEDRIKAEIRSEGSIYKKGFVVDVNVQILASGLPAAYSVTNLHQVIDLPEDND